MKDRKTISKCIEVRLAVIVVIALTVSTLIIFFLNTEINTRNYAQIISSTLDDIKLDIDETSDINMLDETLWLKGKVVALLNTHAADDVAGISKALHDIALDDELSEMSVVNQDNIVVYSSQAKYIGFDMNLNPDTLEFDALNHGASSIVQPVRANAYSGEGSYEEYNKYAGVPIEGVGYLQVAISSQQFQTAIDEKVGYIAANRHIGQTGIVIIANVEDKIVSYSGAGEYETLDSIGFSFDNQKDLDKTLTANIHDEPYMAHVMFVEGYYIIGAVPLTEVHDSRNRAALFNVATEILIFALLFVFIRKMIDKIIVSKIHNINDGLSEIIEGKLDTVISEYSTTEFTSLSDDINSTVSSLKDYMNREQEKIRQELLYARTIQQSAMPKVSALGKFADKFDLYATMNAAKEVGGDFYDFYMLDESRLVVLIADVSGKGVPAAMFMMTCKTMLKNLCESGKPLDEVFTTANERLCANNDADMFVTVWMGILDLKTGDLEYVNAGHNPPLIYNENGDFEYLRSKAGFVLAGMDCVRYKSQKAHLNPGDKLFLYTDGITEATDPDKQLYGEDRLLSYMNAEKDKPMKDILLGLKQSIDIFCRDAEQFDDITMLGVRYKKP